MLKDSFERPETDRRRRDNPLASYLAPFAAALVENGYVKSTVQSKLKLLASLGQWLERRRLSITDFDEQLTERFIAYKRRKDRVHRGNALSLTADMGTVPTTTSWQVRPINSETRRPVCTVSCSKVRS